MQAQFSNALEKLQIAEYTDAVRDWASSPLAIAMLSLGFEAYTLRQKLMPFKPFTHVTLPRSGTVQPIFVPDLFVLLEATFWSPVAVWLLTSVFIPLTISYFINIPLKTQPTHNYGTRRATAHASTDMQYDPFVYFVAKAFIGSLIYSRQFKLFGAFNEVWIDDVNESVYGGYTNVLTTSGIGAALSLYEAVLRK